MNAGIDSKVKETAVDDAEISDNANSAYDKKFVVRPVYGMPLPEPFYRTASEVRKINSSNEKYNN
jgi:hypothetical protein